MHMGMGGRHAEEAAYQQTEGLQLAHFLYPNIVPTLWSPILTWPLTLTLLQIRGPAQIPSNSLSPHNVCAKHS